MAIKITLAKTPEQIDAVFKLRYSLQQELDNDEGRCLNRFDGYPTTSHLVVEDNQNLVAGLRLCMDSSIGIPADVSYNFRGRLSPSDKVIGCDMYYASEGYHTVKIAQGLLLMASYLAKTQQATHIITSINPAVLQLNQNLQLVDKEESLLAEKAQKSAFESSVVLPISKPVILEVAAIKDFFADFVKLNQMDEFLSSFESVFYEEGDYIIRAGDSADCVYLMVDGEANVIHPRKYRMINTLKPGDIFGELALLEIGVGVRTASVIAKKAVKVMRLDKTAFMDYLFANPEKAMDFMARISEQMKRTND